MIKPVEWCIFLIISIVLIFLYLEGTVGSYSILKMSCAFGIKKCKIRKTEN